MERTDMMKQIIRAQYRAALRKDMAEEKLDRAVLACRRKMEKEKQEGRLLTGGLFRYHELLFLYMEYVTEGSDHDTKSRKDQPDWTEIPEQWFPEMAPFLHTWQELSGEKHWAYMYPVFWVAIGTKSGIEPVTCAVVGALLGFLLFNVYPASVFMGDTGSLALGGFVAGTAYMLQMPLFIIIVGFIYLVEVASVMIQVTYFKKTGGKRIFKMAPIHHHFELCGWSETRVVAVFSIITALLCLIALMGV